MDQILISVGDGIGNTIAVTPMIRALSEIFRINVLASCNFKDGWMVLQNMIEIENIYISEKDVSLDKYKHIISTLGGLKNLSKPPTMVTPSNYYLKSEIENNMEVARQLGYEGPTPATFCSCGPKIEGNRICMHNGVYPGTVWERKTYPYFNELVKMVIERFDCDVWLVGQEKYDIQNDRVVHATGKPILETASIIKHSKFFIDTDSGLAHMGEALGTHTYIIFGPTSIMKNAPPRAHIILPRCTPCQEFWPNGWEKMGRWGNCKNWVCMTIKPEKILDKINENENL